MEKELFLEGLKLLFYFLMFALVLIGAKYTTEFIAKRNQSLMQSGQVKLIERVPLSKDREIILIEYDENRYLLSTTAQQSVVIDKFNLKDRTDENES